MKPDSEEVQAALTDINKLADNWKDSDVSAGSHGPEKFGFLTDEMFDYD
jgi:hypothetical protein